MAMLNKINIDDTFIGKVLEINRTTREVAVHLPQLMAGINAELPQSLSQQTNRNVKVSGIEFSDTIITRNSFWTRPMDYDQPLPKVGSRVFIRIIDGNSDLVFWSKFNPNNNYEVIDEEKYSKLFNLDVNNTKKNIFEEDTVKFEFDNAFKISQYDKSDKEKIVSIGLLSNYIISDRKPSNPFNGMLWYNSDTELLYLYKNGLFERIMFETEINELLAKRIMVETEINELLADLDARISVLEP